MTDEAKWAKLFDELGDLKTEQAVTNEKIGNIHERLDRHDEEHKTLGSRIWAAVIAAGAAVASAIAGWVIPH